MTRVSEKSNSLSLKHAMNKTKHKMEELQLKGTTLKRINKPSDDPIGNVQVLAYSSKKADNDQFIKNADFALLHLQFIENAIVELTEITNRAKELAIGQASDFYDGNIRSGVAKEIRELNRSALAIGNRRLGNRYIFAGHKTLTKPFDNDGNYQGDDGSITLEVSKDFFTPINIPGSRLFIHHMKKTEMADPLKPFRNEKEDLTTDPLDTEIGRGIASQRIDVSEGDLNQNNGQKYSIDYNLDRQSLFGQLSMLATGMENNDTNLIQDLLVQLDNSHERLVTERTSVGAMYRSVMDSKDGIESNNVVLLDRRSKIADADVADVFMDLTKQQGILKTAYKAGQGLMNMSLLDFLG